MKLEFKTEEQKKRVKEILGHTSAWFSEDENNGVNIDDWISFDKMAEIIDYIRSNGVDMDFVERIYAMYPSKCPVRDISTGKCRKDKDRIIKLMKTYTKDEIEKVVKREIDDKLGKHPLKNFATFLNNFPDPKDAVYTYPESIDAMRSDDIMPTFSYFKHWVMQRCDRLWSGILTGYPTTEGAFETLAAHTVGGKKTLCYVTLVLNRDGWERYDDKRGFMFIYANYIKANGLYKD